MKKSLAFLSALMMLMPTAATLANAADNDSYDMQITIDLSGEKKAISPYIFGVNEYGNQSQLKTLKPQSIRQGGNRTTAYNWENNASNAGADWKHSSDDNLSQSNDPADCVQVLSKEATANNIPYKLATVQMAGYVSADKDGTVTEEEAAPSKRWNEVVLTKDGEFADTPDLTDGKVYMDEYVNYIVKKLGGAKTATGIQGYSLDNEPALWNSTHPRMHPEKVTIAELMEKSVTMATAIKKIDPDAEVFGPSLYGYTAFDHLADDETTDEWEKVKEEGGYHWYLDCYLDQMKKASEECGTRLLDVLDIHYYSESARNGAEDRLQSVRTLYEEGFVENSWIGQWCMENVPILPTIQKSIDTYYPGTKLGISEYNFGGGDISGTIAQAEALGCYADAGVYFATLWSGDENIYAGMRLYTNYDGNGSTFGDTLVPTVTKDVALSSAYAAINGTDEGMVTAVITNKDMKNAEDTVISLDNAKSKYAAAAVYAVSGDDTQIHLIDIIDDVKDNKVNVTLPAYSAAMVVITDDAADFKDLEIYDPSKISQTVVTFDHPEDMINGNGFVEVPITDPEHLSKIIISGDVTSPAGSAWGGVGCAIGLNVKDKNGVGFWTSKTFELALGNDSSATVEFDGTFENEDKESVEAVIADGKIEIQEWWQYSEKQEAEIEDTLKVTYKSVQVVYETEAKGTEIDPPKEEKLVGDVDMDGDVNINDVILLSRYITEEKNLPITEAGLANADTTEDGTVNADDVTKIIRIIAKLDN